MIEELTITLTNAGHNCLEYAISKMITSCEKEEPEKMYAMADRQRSTCYERGWKRI